MIRFLRTIAGLLTVPFCLAAFKTTLNALAVLSNSAGGNVPVALLAFCAGFGTWLVIFVFLPRPVRTYVFAHELTHVLWAFLSGVSVRGMHVSRGGGSVRLSQSSFLIALAPYFFPIYTVMIVLGYYVVWIFVDPAPAQSIWIGLIGFTWCFHLTFTIKAMSQGQEDISMYGWVFAYPVIMLMNLLIVDLGLVAVTEFELESFVKTFSSDIIWVWSAVLSMSVIVFDWLMDRLNHTRYAS